MDGDDVMRPVIACRSCERPFARIPDVDIVASRAYMLGEDSSVVGSFREPPPPSRPLDYLKDNPVTHPTVGGRLSWFRANRYREDLLRAQDKELWLRTREHTRILRLDDHLLYYRVPKSVRGRQYAASSSVRTGSCCASSDPEFVGRGKMTRMLIESLIKQVVVPSPLPILQRRIYGGKSTLLGVADQLEAENMLLRVQPCCQSLAGRAMTNRSITPEVTSVIVTYGDQVEALRSGNRGRAGNDGTGSSSWWTTGAIPKLGSNFANTVPALRTSRYFT